MAKQQTSWLKLLQQLMSHPDVQKMIQGAVPTAKASQPTLHDLLHQYTPGSQQGIPNADWMDQVATYQTTPDNYPQSFPPGGNTPPDWRSATWNPATNKLEPFGTNNGYILLGHKTSQWPGTNPVNSFVPNGAAAWDSYISLPAPETGYQVQPISSFPGGAPAFSGNNMLPYNQITNPITIQSPKQN